MERTPGSVLSREVLPFYLSLAVLALAHTLRSMPRCISSALYGWGNSWAYRALC